MTDLIRQVLGGAGCRIAPVMVAIAATACSFDPSGLGIDGGDSPVDGNTGDGDPTAIDAAGPSALRKSITISPPNIAETLVDFPVAVLIDGDQDLQNSTRPDGADLVFTAADGTTVLSYEIEQFNKATGSLTAWVRLPQLPPAGIGIYLYYGNPDAGSRQDVNGTWSASVAGVWHLVENPNGNDSQFTDSTSAGNHALASGTQRPTQQSGMAGPALEFDGVDDVAPIGDPGDGSLDHDTGPFSVSLWVNVTQSSSAYDIPWFKGTLPLSDPGYDIELGTENWFVWVSDGQDSTQARFGAETDYLGGWVHLVAVLDRNSNQLLAYANGQLRDQIDAAQIDSTSTTAAASVSQEAYPFNGVLDEVRVYSTALSTSWIATEYDNLADTGNFLAVGAEEEAPYPP